MSEPPLMDEPPAEETPPAEPPAEEATATEPPPSRMPWRLVRAGIIGLLIGGVVIIVSHLGR